MGSSFYPFMRRLLIVSLLILLVACGGEIVPEEPEVTEPNATEPEDTEPDDTTPEVSNNVTTTEPADTPTTPDVPSGADGQIVFAITDAAIDMGDISRVNVQIRGAMIHDSTKNEWITLEMSDTTYDLLALKSQGVNELIVDANIPAGKYDKVQLNFGEIEVNYKGSSVTARMPGKVFRVDIETFVDPHQASTILFDFIADESMHITGQGRVIFAPVAKVETRRQVALTVLGNQVPITQGTITASQKVGMDHEGNVGVDKIIPAGADLSYENNKVLLKKVDVPPTGRKFQSASDEDKPEGYDYQESTLGSYGSSGGHTQCSLRYSGGDCV